MAYIGLDIGTSGCKAAVLTESAKTVAYAHEEYELLFPREGYVELDPMEIYRKIKIVLKRLSPKAGEVRSLALSCFGEAFVLLDGDGNVLNRFITYADSRCEGIDKRLMEKLPPEEFFEITGAYPNQTFSLCKLIWLRENRPEIMKRARRLYLADDFYNYLLCGNGAVDAGTASKTLLLDIHQYDWSDKIMDAFGIDRAWFSPVKEVGTPLGRLRGELAAELGLPRDTVVYLGCHDQISASLGGGAYAPGSAMIGEGSTESVNLVTGASVFGSAEQLFTRKMCLEPFLLRDTYMIPIGILTYGNAIRWYIKTLEKETRERLPEGGDIFGRLEERCRGDTNLIFIPHLSRVNIMNPGTELPGAFVGVTLDTEKWEFYRAVIQGLNFETRKNLETVQKTGIPLDSVSATGGITKSGIFMQMKADILQQEIRILENPEAGITGLSIICAVACGDYKSYADAADRFVSVKKVFIPRKNYDALYKAFIRVRDRLGVPLDEQD